MKKYLFEVGQQLADVFYNQENIKPLNQNRMKTAVEWLVQQLRNGKEFNDELIQQAKEMEKEQIIDACKQCSYSYEEAEQYYKETFKSE